MGSMRFEACSNSEAGGSVVSNRISLVIDKIRMHVKSI